MYSIFLLEDDLDDQELFKDALSRVNPNHSLQMVTNGQQGLDSLHQSITVPDVIFTDINMPILNGVEFVKEIKKSERFNTIPVVMLSSAEAPNIFPEINQLGSFFSKPADFKGLCQVIENGVAMVTPRPPSPTE